MQHIDYFKLQAKNLFKDYKTRFYNEEEEIYNYKPQFFDITQIFLDYGLDDNDPKFSFTLMKAQHIIAKLVDFPKWNDLQKAKPEELELAHLLFDNAHKISLEEWYNWYIPECEKMNNIKFTTNMQIQIFKEVYLKADEHRSDYMPYRLDLLKKWYTSPTALKEEEIPNFSEIYEELNDDEKMVAIHEHPKNGFDRNPDDVIECLHCGARYKFKEVKAIRKKLKYRTANDFDEIVCKNFPKCNGDILDLIPVNITEEED